MNFLLLSSDLFLCSFVAWAYEKKKLKTCMKEKFNLCSLQPFFGISCKTPMAGHLFNNNTTQLIAFAQIFFGSEYFLLAIFTIILFFLSTIPFFLVYN